MRAKEFVIENIDTKFTELKLITKLVKGKEYKGGELPVAYFTFVSPESTDNEKQLSFKDKINFSDEQVYREILRDVKKKFMQWQDEIWMMYWPKQIGIIIDIDPQINKKIITDLATSIFKSWVPSPLKTKKGVGIVFNYGTNFYETASAGATGAGAIASTVGQLSAPLTRSSSIYGKKKKKIKESQKIGFYNVKFTVDPEDFKQGVFPFVYVYNSGDISPQQQFNTSDEETYQKILSYVQNKLENFLDYNDDVSTFAFDSDISPEIDKRLKKDLMKTVLKGFTVEPGILSNNSGKVLLFSRPGMKRSEYEYLR